MEAGNQLVALLTRLGFIDESATESLTADHLQAPIRTLARECDFDELEAILAVGKALDLSYYDLDELEQAQDLEIEQFQEDVPPDLCWDHRVIPIQEKDGEVIVACANPLDHQAIKELRFILDKPILPVMAEEAKIVRLLDTFFPRTGPQYDELRDTEPEDQIEILANVTGERDLDQQHPNLPAIIRLCNKLISDGVIERASDIHIEPSRHGVDIRFRVDGVMNSVFELPKRLQSYVIARLKLLSGMDIAERRRPQDGRFRVRVARKQVDLRVSTVPTAHGEKVVLRLLYADEEHLSFSALGVPKEIEQALLKKLNQRGKLLLVTGPTGSGKTTTLYTCLKYLKDGTSNIETVEDPIEYQLPGIHQIQVNEAINVTFASALRSILRQDPDIIMIGEIRDSETARIALQAAQTGHLVLSTLHTNDAPSAIIRLLDLGVEPFLVASSLGGVLAQRLVRKNCSECLEKPKEEEVAPHLELLKSLGIDPDMLRVGGGCPKCGSHGLKGRTIVASYFDVTTEIVGLIQREAPSDVIVTSARKHGHRSLQEAAIQLLRKGVVPLAEVLPLLALEPETAAELNNEELVEVPSAEAPTPPTQQESAKSVATKSNGKAAIPRQRVLLVEDDPDVRVMLSELLEREMLEVFQAENGQAGLKLVFEHQPDIVLCDLMMPVLDGREFLLKMRANQHTRDIPVVVLTAVDTEENEIDLLELGAHDFVSKGTSSKVMLTRLRRILAEL